MIEATSISAKTFAVCVVVLYFKFVVTARLQAVNTFAAGGRPPEDKIIAEMSKREGPPQTYGLMIDIAPEEKVLDVEAKEKHSAALIKDQRWKRIIANDTESIPLGMLVFGAGLVVESQEIVQVVAMILFTVARFLHTIMYAKGIQPHRSFSWVISVVALIIGAVNALVSVCSK